MRRLFVGCFTLIGVLVVLLTLVGAGGAWYLASRRRQADLPGNAILTINFEKGVHEGPTGDSLTGILSQKLPTMTDVLEALRRGSDDPRIKGFFADIGEGSLGFAQTEELRDAIAAFRAKGKFAVAFSTSFGELGPGTAAYYLASSFDQIWLQPVGIVGITGLRAETPFLKNTLDRLGVEPRIEKRSEYKSAPDSATSETQSAPDKEQLTALLGSMYGQVVSGIADGRKLDPAAVRSLIDRGPLLADEAVAAKLVDHIGYRDEALAAARALAAGPGDLVSVPTLLARTKAPEGRTVALIQAVGTIVASNGETSPLTGSTVVSAENLTRAFRQAMGDKDVGAILFRIDSPGGSAVASETIWREIVRARAAHKPVIVSMGNVAASGGYYIAADADKIIAEPGTITGSIGVFGGKVLLSGLLAKIGAHMEGVQVGANADMWSTFQDYSPAERERLTRFIDVTYAAFKDRVATGRKLSPDAVERVARGRVWSGTDAKTIGLVDALGGYETAQGAVRQALGLQPAAALTLKPFTGERQTWWERILSRLDQTGGAVDRLSLLLKTASPVFQTLDGALSARPGDLRMDPIEVR